jgi:hypothetical protein
MGAWSWLIGALAVLGIVAALYGLHRLCLWLEERGLLYYRRKKPDSSPASCLVAFQQVIEPGVKHVVEIKQNKPKKSQRASRERFLADLVDCLAATPTDVEQVRHLLAAAGRAGLDWRQLYEDAVQARRSAQPELAHLLPAVEAVGPVQ